MKTKPFLVAALAALSLSAAMPAAAQDYRRGDNWRNRPEITIRDHGRQFSVTRGDRLFYRLLDRPYHFRPGLTYAYTNRCGRAGCEVLVFSARSRRPIDRIVAPQLPRRGDGWRDDDRRDGGYRDDDRRGDDRYDRRDDDRRGDSRLEGGPR